MWPYKGRVVMVNNMLGNIPTAIGTLGTIGPYNRKRPAARIGRDRRHKAQEFAGRATMPKPLSRRPSTSRWPGW